LPQPTDARAVVDRLFREESGRAVATLIRLTGDFDLAEEAVQEAFVVALERWPRDGLPANPGAWITTTARNRAIDRLRRAKRYAEKEPELRRLAAARRAVGDRSEAEDEMSLSPTILRPSSPCHPALALEVALTLRTLGVAWMTPEMAGRLVPGDPPQRLVRAKKNRDAGIPPRPPIISADGSTRLRVSTPSSTRAMPPHRAC
jgi:RNA polymerase sigma-70 factor (ECF subfamily)